MSTATTPREPGSGSVLAVFLGGFVVTALILGLGVGAARRHQDEASEARRDRLAAASEQACRDRGALFVTRRSELRSLVEPFSDAWSPAHALEIPLQAQRIAMPMLEQSSVASVAIQGATDGRSIAWRVSWTDATADGNLDTARFTDAAALQFPVTRNANFSMGDRNQLVQILHWKALWQHDVDEHYQDVQDLHPNYWADLYWFAEGRPYRVPDSFTDPASLEWFPAFRAGNRLSDIHRSRAVEELAAEGYGSLTAQPDSVTTGRGVWRDGTWSVVFLRPLRTGDALDYQFWLGGGGQVGIAVWDGAAGNVGGRKHWSNWVDFEVSP